jgi:hypothetical protein
MSVPCNAVFLQRSDPELEGKGLFRLACLNIAIVLSKYLCQGFLHKCSLFFVVLG